MLVLPMLALVLLPPVSERHTSSHGQQEATAGGIAGFIRVLGVASELELVCWRCPSRRADRHSCRVLATIVGWTSATVYHCHWAVPPRPDTIPHEHPRSYLVHINPLADWLTDMQVTRTRCRSSCSSRLSSISL